MINFINLDFIDFEYFILEWVEFLICIVYKIDVLVDMRKRIFKLLYKLRLSYVFISMVVF